MASKKKITKPEPMKPSGYVKSVSAASLQKYNSYNKFEAVATTTVSDVTIRQPFGRSEYDYYRPNESVPTSVPEIIRTCRNMYKSVGVVRNVIDLMTDFACEDLKIVASDPKEQIFYNAWIKRTDLNAIANEFARHFLLDCNVVVKRVTAKVSKPVERLLSTAKRDYDLRTEDLENKTEKREIPWRYSFLDVTLLDWSNEDLFQFDEAKQLTFTMSAKFKNKLKAALAADVEKKLPKDIREQISKGKVTLDMSKLCVMHNKKDSWEPWATPFLKAVLPDIFFKYKLRQADMSALDGVINVIRLWKLGDHKEGILPTEAVVDKLINILSANTGGGAIDLVWDSMIEMQDYYPPIDKILGSDKYTQVDKDILVGLGVPEVLLGGGGSNFSNSWIQLKTLVEKLKTVRYALLGWLRGEIKMIHKNMSFKSEPHVLLGEMNLSDENVAKKLIVSLWDRGLISDEAVRDVYHQDNILELERMGRQDEVNKKYNVQTKGPFVNDPVDDLSNTGGRPSQTPGDGDNDDRTPKPLTGSLADYILYATDLIDQFDEVVVPSYLQSIGAKNARMLTSEQRVTLDHMRVRVLASFRFGDVVHRESISASLSENCASDDLANYILASVTQFAKQNGSEPSVQHRKRLEAIAWTEYLLSH